MNRKLSLAVLVAGAIPLLLLGSTALGGEGVQVTIKNDGTDDILVTVYDMTVGPNAVVLAHARINGFATIPLSVAPDETGRAPGRQTGARPAFGSALVEPIRGHGCSSPRVTVTVFFEPDR